MDRGLADSAYLARSLSEPVAFESIFERHFAAIHRYLHRRAGRDLADDLAAETFVVAFENRATCKASGSVLPWLYGIATNLLHHSWRSEQRRLRAYARSSAARGSEHDDDAAEGAEGAGLDARVARALMAMRPRERDALLLFALADLSYEEIALALDVPVGTVRTALHRARSTAQRELAAVPTPAALTTTPGDLDE